MDAVALDEIHGAFMQGARGEAVRLALDAPIDRVRGCRCDPGELECPAVRPRTMAIPVGEVDGAIRDDRIDHPSGGRAARIVLHAPTRPKQPIAPRMLGIEGCNRRDGLLGRRALMHVAAQHPDPCHDGVHVRVLETGQHETA